MFGLSHTSDVSISTDTEVNGIIFTPAATNAYTITVNLDITLTLSGTGIMNNSGVTQNFMVGSGLSEGTQMRFTNSTSAGNATIMAGDNGAQIDFFNRSTAASATFFIGNSNSINFFNTSTAGSSLIDNANSIGARMNFADNSTAGSATLNPRGHWLYKFSPGTLAQPQRRSSAAKAAGLILAISPLQAARRSLVLEVLASSGRLGNRF